MELAVQAARWMSTVINVLEEPALKTNHSELQGLRPNMRDILTSAPFPSFRFPQSDLSYYIGH
jgi:hypothetical protein